MQINVIDPKVTIQDEITPEMLRRIERFGRVCYKSEGRITEDSAARFVVNLIRAGHESVIEHEKITVLFVTNRGVTHEIVRHRIASYSQESTRYCNYGGVITFIRPFYFVEGSAQYREWYSVVAAAAKAYKKLLDLGAKPEEARGVLPNDLKTEIVVTCNLREWRHFFKLRCSKKAHPQIRQIAIPTLLKFRELLPVVFDDLEYDRDFPEKEYAKISW